MSNESSFTKPLVVPENDGRKKVTNQTVLLVTTILFAGFVVAEIVGALAGNSLSLLGDGAAMSVDVMTV
jgi:Co/Zn/Cd efflux system component